jgi:hypothetical protein
MNRVRAVIAMLFAQFPNRLRWLVGILCGIIAAPALFTVFATRSPDVVQSMDILFAFDILIAWVLFAYGSIVLLRDSRALRLPGVRRIWSTATLLFFLVSVVLPALVFGIRSASMSLLLPAYGAAAAAGALLTTIGSRWVGFVPWLVIMAVRSVWSESQIDAALHDPALLWTIAATSSALAVWRGAVATVRVSPPLLTLADARTITGEPLEVHAGADDGSHESHIDRAGAAWKTVAMRCWLGGAYAPTSRRRLTKTLSVIAPSLAVVVIASQFMRSSMHLSGQESLRFATAMALLMALSVLVGFGARLRQQYGRQGGDIAELAVLPSWGDRSQAQDILLSAVFRPLRTYLAAVLAAFAAIGLGLRVDAAALAALCGVVAMSGALCAAHCLHALAIPRPLPSLRALFVAYCVLSGPLFMLSWFSSYAIGWPGALAVASAYCGAAGMFAARVLSRFRVRPHPFLTE